MGENLNNKPELHNRNKHILVCGATGFIGSYLVIRLLKDGYRNIHIISRKMDSCKTLEELIDRNGLSSEYSLYVSVHYGDISNYQWLLEVLKGCGVLFNCASRVSLSGGDSRDLIVNNTSLTYLIARGAKESNVERVIHISSIAALSAQDYPEMTNETHYMTSIDRQTNYALSKFYSENEMWKIYYEGVNVTIVNPGVVLGYWCGKNHSSTSIVQKVIKSLPVSTSGIMGYISVDDVARAMVHLSSCDESIGKRYILCSKNFSYTELISTIKKAAHKSGKTLVFPNWLVRRMGFLSKQLTKSIIDNLTTKYLYDGELICRETNFKYSDIEEEIEEMVKNYKNNR